MAEPNASDQAARAEIVRRLGEAGFALPGTLLEHFHTCRNPNCRCMASPPQPHGPYLRWTRKLDGKTVTQRLSREQFDLYRPWFEEARRLRTLLAELEALSLRVAQRGRDGL